MTWLPILNIGDKWVKKLYDISVIFKESAFWADYFYKSKYLSVCPSAHPSVCLFTFEVPFKCLFTPTSRNWMSKRFRDLESLGKSNEMKWSQIWKFILIKNFALLSRIFLVWVLLSISVERFFVSRFILVNLVQCQFSYHLFKNHSYHLCFQVKVALKYLHSVCFT